MADRSTMTFLFVHFSVSLERIYMQLFSIIQLLSLVAKIYSYFDFKGTGALINLETNRSPRQSPR